MHDGTVMPGQLLGARYQLEQLLGRGAMGQVWLARDLRLKRPVAVKLLSPAGLLDEQDLALFRREAEIGAMLSHPGITTVFDMDGSATPEQLPWYIVMERLVGESLAATLRRHPQGLPVERVIDLAEQVATALGAAHEEGVVHRDIKPANLFLQSSGLVKICDFGISRLANATRILTGVQIAGTLPYMAPEQFSGLDVDHRCDLYALGCVLYELLVGTTWVDPTADLPASMYQHFQVVPPSPRAARPEIPQGLDRLVLDLLAKDPARRPADAAAVRERLQLLRGESGESAGGARAGRTVGEDRIARAARRQFLAEAAGAMRVLHARRQAEVTRVLSQRAAPSDARRPAGPADGSLGRGRAVGSRSLTKADIASPSDTVPPALTAAPVTVANSRWDMTKRLAQAWAQIGAWPLAVLCAIIGAGNPGKAVIPIAPVAALHQVSVGGNAFAGGLAGLVMGTVVLGMIGGLVGFCWPRDRIVVDAEALHVWPARGGGRPFDVPWTAVSSVSLGSRSAKETHTVIRLEFLPGHEPTEAWQRLCHVEKERTGSFIVYEKPKREPGRVDPYELREALAAFSGHRWNGLRRANGTPIDVRS